MQFTTLFTVAATVSMAMAAATPGKKPPGYGGGKPKPSPPSSSGGSCNSGSVKSCCNSNFLGQLLGLNCILSGVAGCNSGSVACCPTTGTQNGIINIGSICIPITI